jgi:hypothetical protein
MHWEYLTITSATHAGRKQRYTDVVSTVAAKGATGWYQNADIFQRVRYFIRSET